MKQFIVKNKRSSGLVIALLLVAGITLSFQDTPYMSKLLNEQHAQKDTTPYKGKDGSMTMKEFDAMQQNLDKTMLQVNAQIKSVDFDKIGETIAASMKDIDVDKIMQSVELSLKSIDFEKIMSGATASLNAVKWDDQKAEIKIDLEEARKDIEKAKEEMKKVNKDEIKKEMENAKEEMKKAEKEYRKIDMPKIMAEAQKGIDKAKEELRETKAMFNEMEKDGLVDPKAGFSIEYKDKDLFINGTKQGERVTDKYRKYFKNDHFKITIDKE